MQEQNYQIVTGVAIATAVLLLAGFFIMILIAHFNRRKKTFIEEKQWLQTQYQAELMKTRIELQEQIFSDISQEIHDNVGQLLSVVKVQLNIVEHKDELDRELVKDMRGNVSQALAELRDIAKSLNGSYVQQRLLPETIQPELKKLERLTNIKTHLTVDGEVCKLDEQRALFTFRMVQESLQNILKHASATNVFLQLYYGIDGLNIKIGDDGRGFNHQPKEAQYGLGIQNITNRCRLLGGSATIESSPGNGTLLIIHIPYA